LQVTLSIFPVKLNGTSQRCARVRNAAHYGRQLHVARHGEHTLSGPGGRSNWTLVQVSSAWQRCGAASSVRPDRAASTIAASERATDAFSRCVNVRASATGMKAARGLAARAAASMALDTRNAL
jgi:hypothetical protein